MTARELRKKFLQFFESKGHSLYPSGSLIPYDVTGRLDESLLFNGAGMVQFKPYFRGVATPPNRRLTNAQKCVRTVDIDGVGDFKHNTFFEMLGNFSFGDYFKKEAIAFSWEFITSPQWLALDPKRVAYTVFEDDIETYELWAARLKSVGIEPSSRIFRLGEESNYWPAGAFTNGPPGPCGPNSEMFHWVSNDVPPPSAPYTREQFVQEEEEGKWLEFWNDVFIQYEWKGHLKNPARPGEGYVKEGLDSLPFQSVDTGMGLERTSVALGGFKSNYDTDLFTPIIRKIEEISRGKVKYNRTDDAKDNAVRVISDHIRTACFCIADGVLPSNTGRGYVLRRLIRRAVLKGQRTLGFEKPFFAQVYEGVVEAVGDHYLELTERRDVILETLGNEEALFRRTLNAGYAILEEELSKLKDQILPGDLAFKLYDTYGFPLEVTRELLEERKLTVDEDGYETALLEAQERSRSSTERETVYGGGGNLNILWVEPGETPAFDGYDRTQQSSRVVLVAEPQQAEPVDGRLGPFLIGLEKTPFYTESGGQVSDRGFIEVEGQKLEVEKMVRVNGQPLHLVNLAIGVLGARDRASFVEAISGATANAVIDSGRRAGTIRNHSATHLLHASLRRILGKHVTQAGSLVDPEHLRFDFTHGKAMSAEEIAEVEKIVNEEALANLPVTIFSDIPISEAKERGAMALFGEKYGDKVRMVQMGDFSLELCGGCHVKHTSEVGLFKIISESSAASGVRRIEAITGEKAYDWVREQTDKTREAAALLKANPGDLVGAIERMLNTLKEEKRKVEKMRTQTAAGSSGAVEKVGDLELVIEKLTEGDADEAKQLADRLVDSQPLRVAVVGLLIDGKITFVCKVGAEAVKKGANAGKLVGEIAKIAGGGGGGRPDFATAGGRLPEKFEEAMAAARAVLAGQAGV